MRVFVHIGKKRTLELAGEEYVVDPNLFPFPTMDYNQVFGKFLIK